MVAISFTLLALASAAAAHPGYRHKHRPSGAHPSASGTGLPWSYTNGTGPYNATSGYATGGLTTTQELTSTTTKTSTIVQTVVLTVYPVEASETVQAAANEPTPGQIVCKSRETLYKTVTDRVTVTVQPSAAVEPSSSSDVAPVVESTPVVQSTPAAESTPVAYEEPAISSLVLVSSVEANNAAYTPPAETPAAYTSVEAVSSAAVETPAQYAAQTSAAAPAASTPASYSTGTSGGKRGLAYNDASLTTCFAGKEKVTWAYNWGQTSAGLSNSFTYVPMLWGLRDEDIKNWESNANSAIASGATHLLAFNEPDHHEQANIDAGTAAAGYLKYMQPYAGKAKLGSPAVTNGGSGMGLEWLSSFFSACSSCQIDYAVIHWYDSATNIEYFKKHLTQAHEQTGKPIWLTEFGATGTDEQIASFLKEAMAWMDSQDFVERYAYFMVADGKLNSGSGESSLGSTYATA